MMSNRFCFGRRWSRFGCTPRRRDEELSRSLSPTSNPADRRTAIVSAVASATQSFIVTVRQRTRPKLRGSSVVRSASASGRCWGQQRWLLVGDWQTSQAGRSLQRMPMKTRRTTWWYWLPILGLALYDFKSGDLRGRVVWVLVLGVG